MASRYVLKMLLGLMVSLLFGRPLWADCVGYQPPPPPPLSSLVCNEIVFVTLDGNDYDHSQAGLDYQFTNNNGYKPFNRGVWGTCQGASWGDTAMGVQGKHVLLEAQAHPPVAYVGQPYDSNTDRAKVRILLGPNLRFEDGSREITADIHRAPTFKTYVDVIPTVDCKAVAEAARHPEKAPIVPTSPPVLFKPPPLRTFTCPELPVIRNDVREINRIASRLALDDAYYQAAAEDMLVFGYSSRFAWLAFTGDESSIVAAFANPTLSQATRASVVANTRKKADFRQKLATAMFVYSQGQTYHPPETGDQGITDDVAAYLCTGDPAKMDIPGWDALYHAGYIAAPLYRNLRAKIQANAVMGPIVMAATMDLAPLALGILRIPALAARVSVSAEDVAVLKTVAKGDLSFTSPPTFSTIEQRLLGKDLNALKFGDSSPPFLEDAPAYLAHTNEKTQYVRFFSAKYANKIGGWLVRKALVVDQEGNFLSANEIKNKLALRYAPTHVCDVTMAADTDFWVGTAAPQPKWDGVEGLTEQLYVELKNQIHLTFSDGIALAK